MSLTERITRDIAEAMKAREQMKLSALRMVKAALMNGEVSKGRALDDGEAQQVLVSLIKQRRDSIEQFRSAGRSELVDGVAPLLDQRHEHLLRFSVVEGASFRHLAVHQRGLDHAERREFHLFARLHGLGDVARDSFG